MAVTALVDAPASQLLDALQAVRETPAPLGQAPARLAVLAHAAAELHGVYLRALHQADADDEAAAAGSRSTADLLVDVGLPVAQARADAALARRLGRLPGLLEALAGGGLELPAARLLARAWDALPPRLRDQATAAALVELGGLLDLASLRAKVDELVSALQPEVTDADLADARESAELRLVDVGAQTRFDGHADALTGEWLRDVLAAKAEADRTGADTRTHAQRMFEALVACVRTAVEVGEVPLTDGEPPLLVVVTTPEDLLASAEPTVVEPDPDATLATLFGRAPAAGGTGSRSRGGVPVGPRTLAALSCTSRVARLLTSPARGPLDSSPSARQLSRRERRALEHRAGYRCERLGCGRPASACVAHHVVPWALGGPTTQANSVLLCRSCHPLLHDRDRPLELTEGRRIGPRGWLRGGPDRPPGPAPW